MKGMRRGVPPQTFDTAHEKRIKKGKTGASIKVKNGKLFDL